MNIFDHLRSQIDIQKFQAKELSNLKKFMNLFLLGQLIGLPTLKSILTKFEILSTGKFINYKKICKKLTASKIKQCFEYIFERTVHEKLANMAKKDSSIWSKKRVTAVVDDSVFRQWLGTVDGIESFDKCYGCFFSGQYKAAVYGVQVVTFGLSIENIFYPLYFEFAKKTEKKPKNKTKKPKQSQEEKEQQAAEIKAAKEAEDNTKNLAAKMVKKWGVFLKKNNLNILIDNKLIYFSCDNGYSDMNLEKACEENALSYISVPKKNHIIMIKEEKYTLSDYIKSVFLPAEQAHLEKEENLPKSKKTSFTMRIRATYSCCNRDVVFLFFRLNGSEKVSVIYSTALEAFAKTLRRHWFQRTYIEQFFRLLKHTLKIQENRTRTKDEFEFKISKFFFIALHAQQLVAFLRKKEKKYGKVGFQVIQRQLASEPYFLDLLQQAVG